MPGPVHEYVFPVDELVLPDVKFKVKPEQIGVLLLIVGTGNGFTTTAVVAVAVHPFMSVTVTL